MEQDNAKAEKATKIIDHFMRLNSARSNFATQWEEIAALVRPNSRSTFMFGSYKSPGQKNNYRQLDDTSVLALSRFGSILDSLLTPMNQQWHTLSADNDYLMKDRQVRLWYEQTTKILFKLRYSPSANFSSQNQQNYCELGAFGNATMFIDKLQSPIGERGLRYKALPVGETFYIENHQGLVVGMIRWFRLSPFAAKEQFGGELPEGILEAAKKNSQEPFDFLHYVAENPNYDPNRMSAEFHLYQSCYVSMVGKKILSEGGFNSFPFATSRYEQAPGEVYGRGPAGMVLPTIKGANATKGIFLKQGHRSADPVLLLADDGLMNMDLRPGALNVGGMSAEGRPLVGVLPTGDIKITEEMMEADRSVINDAFLVTLFQILTESPRMSATEVIERTNEKGILLAPTVGRQQSEYLGPMISRELDLASELGLLPPMPPLLREAQGEYSVVYTSPLSRAMRAQEASGFMRTLESSLNIVNATQDPSHLDHYDFDVVIPELARINGVPESFMASDEKIQEARAKREQMQAAQLAIQAAPAEAAMMKAEQGKK